jgi:hypothetical protein
MTTLEQRAAVVGLITAAIETVGFIYWLIEVAAGRGALGLLVFGGVLVVEHVVQAYLLTSRVRFGAILAFSAFETLIVWGAGLAVADAVHLQPLAIVWWAAGLTVEHTLTDNVLRGLKLWARAWDWDNAPASLLEATGGYTALVLLPLSLFGAAAGWFGLNSAEHTILNVRALRP